VATFFPADTRLSPRRSHRRHRHGAPWRRRCLLLTLLALVLVACDGLLLRPVPARGCVPTGTDPRLTEQRAGRRAAMRAVMAAKDAATAPAPFGLLVIPVDFADERFAADWDPGVELAPRLFPLADESLANYFHVASRGLMELRVLLAPTVHLPGERIDYSDIDLNGFHRTREMATAAATFAAELGIDFRLLDLDGPDGLPGSGDDDGEVDGMLILHAGAGTENDADNGRVQALQYFLDVPVEEDGTRVVAYAVASAHSGVGIWAHETGHLLGLEERYDPYLPTLPGQTTSRGGLGRFSVMAAGAWGSGSGHQPPLLDAYSCLQLGWCSVQQLRGEPSGAPRTVTVTPAYRDGEVYRVWTRGEVSNEYFLLETRGGAAVHPFDADIPAGHLLIYHVDESLPEGAVSGDAVPHLRVRLVEADDDGLLAAGDDTGSDADLFPGRLGRMDLSPRSVPSSAGYDGPTEVALTAITPGDDGVSVTVTDAASHGHEFSLAFSGDEPADLLIELRETGLPYSTVTATVLTVAGDQWGVFSPGGDTAIVPLARAADGRWTPEIPVAWNAAPDLPAGATSTFRIVLAGSGEFGDWTAAAIEQPWVWVPDAGILDFAHNWHDGAWQIETAATDHETTWQRWETTDLTTDGSPVLICTGAEYDADSDWSAVRYFPWADARLISQPLPTNLAGVVLIHAIDCKLVRSGVAVDGGVVEWQLPDGSRIPATVRDGHESVVDPRSVSALHGQPVFAGTDTLSSTGMTHWRLDFIELPEHAGPLRLCLRFASAEGSLRKGWIIAGLELVSEIPAAGLFPVAVTGDVAGGGEVLAWSYAGAAADTFAVQVRAAAGENWFEVWRGVPAGAAGIHDFAVPLSALGSALTGDPTARHELRVVAAAAVGDIRSRPLVYHADGGGDTLSFWTAPYPNPAARSVRLLLGLPADATGTLTLFDCRGRLVRRWELIGGSRLLVWQGADARGAPVPAGVYFFRLTTAGRTETRKVVWLR